jgi:hypothetical protein
MEPSTYGWKESVEIEDCINGDSMGTDSVIFHESIQCFAEHPVIQVNVF